MTWVWDTPFGLIEDVGTYRIKSNEITISFDGEDDETIRFERKGRSIFIGGLEYRRQ